jgi:hypothetical protein
MNLNPYDNFLSRIQGFRSVPTKPGFSRAGRCFCPAHQSVNHSQSRTLSIAEGMRGVLVMHCKAGCTNAEIVASVGLNLADLFPTQFTHHSKSLGTSWHSLIAAADGIEYLSYKLITSKTSSELFENQVNLCNSLNEFRTSIKQALKTGGAR